MSILKDLTTKRFWLAVMLAIFMALLVCAVGAFLTVSGLSSVERVGIWICLAWLVAAFAGGRYVSKGQGQALLRGLMSGVVSAGLLWLLGLTAGEGSTVQTAPWRYIAAALGGIVLAAALPRKTSRGKKKGRQATRAT